MTGIVSVSLCAFAVTSGAMGQTVPSGETARLPGPRGRPFMNALVAVPLVTFAGPDAGVVVLSGASIPVKKGLSLNIVAPVTALFRHRRTVSVGVAAGVAKVF